MLLYIDPETLSLLIQSLPVLMILLVRKKE